MNVRKWLIDADPFAREGALDAKDVERMRQRVVAEASERQRSPGIGRQLAWAGALAVLVLVALAGLGQRRTQAPDQAMPPDGATAIERDRVEPAKGDSRRQLQFATPGGTRIIWVFNSDFKI